VGISKSGRGIMLESTNLPIGCDQQIAHVAVRVVDQIVPKPYLRDLLHPIDSVRRAKFHF
jgi:hypothetical protein